jgi:hypothetical protein
VAEDDPFASDADDDGGVEEELRKEELKGKKAIGVTKEKRVMESDEDEEDEKPKKKGKRG